MAIRPDVDDVIKFLNELLELDRPAIAALIANRVPCNEALGMHPTVQVGAQHGGYHVGLLGILNGYFGVFDDGPRVGAGAITAIFGDGAEGETGLQLIRFEVGRNDPDMKAMTNPPPDPKGI